MALSPSQRVTLMKEIANQLGTEPWKLINVTLEQFSLPTDDWSGTKDDYVFHMINDAPDHALTDLAKHVGHKFGDTGTAQVAPSFWRTGMLRVFISHLSTKSASAAQLQEALLEYGISAFVAHNDIEPTQEWQTQIEIALATCDALIAVMHDGFHASNWTDQEIGFAMGRGVPTFSIRCGQDPYGFIGRFQAFNGNKRKIADVARELFDAYRKNKQTQRQMCEAMVGLFEASDNFAEAKERIGYLEDFGVWDPSFSKRIKAAAKTNSQVRGSWGVSDRITALVKKWAA
jgi:hypothetical protein